jgi:uncharacterized hydrophobic protein (TIGR00271 family)
MSNITQKDPDIDKQTHSQTADSGSNSLSHNIFTFLKELIDLEEDKADEDKAIEEIKKGVVFKGTNLWILIFAIFIASIGLNVNSPAVIIGAMLISPLMGPIIGIGLGIGINDLGLIKKGLLNLSIAAVISVLTSTIYFSITPLSDAQSELLARTTPTLWDVLIATLGGLAGIIAGSRKEKSNAVPGVAIATALMPPLCTAGFGLATGNMYYFFGAFYLFFINSVFISLSTFVMVRYLKYKKKEFDDIRRKKQVKSIITVFVLLGLLPSIYTAFHVVKKSLYERNASRFINQELSFDNARVISKEVKFNGDANRVEIVLLGKRVSQEMISQAEKKLSTYGLFDTKLIVHQGYQENGSEMMAQINQNLKAGIVEELYKQNEDIVKNKDNRIALLEAELLKYQKTDIPVADISREIKVQYRTIEEFSLSKSIIAELTNFKQDTVYLAFAKFKKKPKPDELNQLKEWLIVRTKNPSIKLISEY